MVGHRETPPSAAAMAASIDHVRLSYLYIDAGDFDAYASLLDNEMRVRGIGARVAQGREQAVDAVRARSHPLGRHALHRTMASGDCVVAIGRFTAPATALEPAVDFEFADVFIVSEAGLLLSQRRFYYPELPEP